VYGQKEAYIAYLQSLRLAFDETDPSKLLERWAMVDTTWMGITGSIQPVHPLECYDDQIRHAVSMESDLRIRDSNIYQSTSPEGIRSFFELIVEEK
jgi:hypothetical protein